MKVTYSKKYKKGTVKIKEDKLPRLPHLNGGWYVKEAEVMEEGQYDDGTEYCVLKITVKDGVIK